ncbi:HPP family protein [Paenibacillus aurantius]|uniref:HPP family protein n=1 Tax=Paenibacillus aurantius TaxID=2918900 RepID=A0AA96RD96_9BACL|nr:HPP family protein [Paenibacillus aurantius]WNQ09582.1 HPP family protein [Paenibacillus aurantius]
MRETYFSKMKGSGKSPLQVLPWNAFMGFLGGLFTIGLLSTLTDLTSAVWIMAPFGASCVLAFGVWEAPLSQPRNIIGGHLISTLVGLIFYHSFGPGVLVTGLAVGTATAAMMLTKTTHPPAGADPIVVILAGSGWWYLISPVLLGSVLVVILALLVNNASRHRKYPTFWY